MSIQAVGGAAHNAPIDLGGQIIFILDMARSIRQKFESHGGWIVADNIHQVTIQIPQDLLVAAMKHHMPLRAFNVIISIENGSPSVQEILVFAVTG